MVRGGTACRHRKRQPPADRHGQSRREGTYGDRHGERSGVRIGGNHRDAGRTHAGTVPHGLRDRVSRSRQCGRKTRGDGHDQPVGRSGRVERKMVRGFLQPLGLQRQPRADCRRQHRRAAHGDGYGERSGMRTEADRRHAAQKAQCRLRTADLRRHESEESRADGRPRVHVRQKRAHAQGHVSEMDQGRQSGDDDSDVHPQRRESARQRCAGRFRRDEDFAGRRRGVGGGGRKRR